MPNVLPRDVRLSIVRRVAPDVAKYLPLPFDANFDSPCWRPNDTALRCLPAFFLAGGMQCGVYDAWARLSSHQLIPRHHDALSHWWTNHPRSSAGDFDKYVNRFSGAKTLARVAEAPRTLLGEASPASLTFMMAEQLRLHYLYLDAFDACARACHGKSPPDVRCGEKGYRMLHCYGEASRATVPIEFNLPAFASTIIPRLRVMALVREPAMRLWIAYWNYGQFPAKYGRTAAGFGYYFSNQSLAFDTCATRGGPHYAWPTDAARRCALRFEAHGPEEADVYYHADQIIKGMYDVFVEEWLATVGRERLLVMRSEDYFRAPARAVARMWRWLGLRVTPKAREAAARVEIKDERTKVVEERGMPPRAALAAVRALA